MGIGEGEAAASVRNEERTAWRRRGVSVKGERKRVRRQMVLAELGRNDDCCRRLRGITVACCHVIGWACA